MRRGADGFALRASLDEAVVELTYHQSRGRTARVNGQTCPRLTDLYGHIKAVFFSPDDLWLAKGGPSWRRRLLDSLLLQTRPTYAATLAGYEEALAQRNALLRDVRARRSGAALLEIWEDQLVEYGEDVAARRSWIIALLADEAGSLYARLATGERFSCRYASGIGAEWTAEAFKAALARSQRSDIERGFTAIGPHRDDLLCELDGQPLRTFGSQGQQRSAVLALKLAEAQALRQITGEEHLLLLDDVHSELDRARSRGLAEVVTGGGQVLLTATDVEALPDPFPGPARVFRVDGGRIVPPEA